MEDALAGAVWAIVTLLLLRTAWNVAQAIEPEGTTFQQLLHATIIAWAGLVVCVLLLGMVGCLYATTLAINLSVFSLALRRLLPVMSRHPNLKTLTDYPRLESAKTSSSDRENLYLLAWGVVAAIWIAWVILNGVLEFPSEWDTLDYHIVVIDTWLLTHSLYGPDCQEWYVPGNNEVIGLWLVGLFSGDYLIGFINLPAVFLLALGILELGRQVGIPTPFRHLTAIVAITTEAVFRQALSAKNDAASVAILVTALAYIFRHIQMRRQSDMWFGAAALGLLAGIKYYSTGYVAVAVTMWGLCCFVIGGWHAMVRVVLAVLVCLLVFGGYWYIRNTIVSGTPFYPKGFVSKTDALSQWRPGGVWSTTLAGNGDQKVLPLLSLAIQKHASPLAFTAVLFLPVVLAWLMLSRWLPSTKEISGWVTRWGLTAYIIGAGLVWAVTPFAVEIHPGSLQYLRNGHLPVRFGLCFLTLSLVAMGVFIGECWSRTRSTPMRVFLLCATLAAVLWHYYSVLKPRLLDGKLTEVFLTAAVLYSAGILVRQMLTWPERNRRLLALTSAAFTVISLATFNAYLAAEWHTNFVPYFKTVLRNSLFAKVGELSPPPKKVFVAAHRTYPFAGSHRQTIICRELRLMIETRFWAYLLSHDVSHVLISSYDKDWAGHFNRIREWVKNRPEVFRPIMSEGVYTLYEIDVPALTKLTVQPS
jgi:hypothetical protein